MTRSVDSIRAKGRDSTPVREPKTLREECKEDFDSKVNSYENYVDVEDLNDHNTSFFKFMKAQGWEVGMISTLESKVALPHF